MIGTVVVLAKAPAPGRVKTRLCPPLRHDQAARLAAAALADTLDAVRAMSQVHRVLAVHGTLPGPAHGFTVIPQRGAGHAARIVAALDDAAALRRHGAGEAPAGGPLLLVGSDTPQLDPRLLDDALRAAATGSVVLGPSEDGGWWALGVPRAGDAAPVAGVPMSTGATGELTRRALVAVGAQVVELARLRDVDSIADARAVAAAAPGTRFARCLDRLGVNP